MLYLTQKIDSFFVLFEIEWIERLEEIFLCCISKSRRKGIEEETNKKLKQQKNNNQIGYLNP